MFHHQVAVCTRIRRKVNNQVVVFVQPHSHSYTNLVISKQLTLAWCVHSSYVTALHLSPPSSPSCRSDLWDQIADMLQQQPACVIDQKATGDTPITDLLLCTHCSGSFYLDISEWTLQPWGRRWKSACSSSLSWPLEFYTPWTTSLRSRSKCVHCDFSVCLARSKEVWKRHPPPTSLREKGL